MKNPNSKTLRELASLVKGEIVGKEDTVINGVAPIEEAKEGEITFIANPKYWKKVSQTKASAIIVPLDAPSIDKPLIKTENPYLAYAKIVTSFHPPYQKPWGIDKNIIKGRQTSIGKDVSIYPFVFIGDKVSIGDRTIIYPFCFIGDEVSIGEDTLVYSNVTIRERCKIGKRVIIHSGTVIGSDGFGFAKDGTSYFKIPQVGIVEIEDDVEIGANNTIDRAALGKTLIKRGVKTDNLVHIAHNVVVGEDTLLIAQVGISGSTKIGNRVILAGQVGVVGHVTIGDDVVVGAQSGVTGNVASGQVVSGYPHMPHRDWLKASRTFPKLPEMRKKMIELEKRIHELEKEIKYLKEAK